MISGKMYCSIAVAVRAPVLLVRRHLARCCRQLGAREDEEHAEQRLREGAQQRQQRATGEEPRGELHHPEEHRRGARARAEARLRREAASAVAARHAPKPRADEIHDSDRGGDVGHGKGYGGEELAREERDRDHGVEDGELHGAEVSEYAGLPTECMLSAYNLMLRSEWAGLKTAGAVLRMNHIVRVCAVPRYSAVPP